MQNYYYFSKKQYYHQILRALYFNIAQHDNLLGEEGGKINFCSKRWIYNAPWFAGAVYNIFKHVLCQSDNRRY